MRPFISSSSHQRFWPLHTVLSHASPIQLKSIRLVSRSHIYDMQFIHYILYRTIRLNIVPALYLRRHCTMCTVYIGIIYRCRRLLILFIYSACTVNSVCCICISYIIIYKVEVLSTPGFQIFRCIIMGRFVYCSTLTSPKQHKKNGIVFNKYYLYL